MPVGTHKTADRHHLVTGLLWDTHPVEEATVIADEVSGSFDLAQIRSAIRAGNTLIVF